MATTLGRPIRVRARLVLAWLAAAHLASACHPSPATKGCRVDSDCGDGTCQAGLCQAVLKLAITSPVSGTATNGTTHVEVDVQGGSPAEVQLMVGAVPLVKVEAPYRYDWDTTRSVQGTHDLWARVQA